MSINLTLLGQTIAMVVFVWFTMRFVWPYITRAIEERQVRIADGLAAAERGQQKLAESKREAQKIVAEARAQATAILDQAHARANEIVAEGKAEGTRERERQLELARAEVEQEIHRAREELRGEVSAIAVASAEKILRREIDPAAHEDILASLAAEI